MTQIHVVTTRLTDIGELDGTKHLPTAGRIKAGMKTICIRCMEPVTDEFFVAGFKAGMPNMIFHEGCVNR